MCWGTVYSRFDWRQTFPRSLCKWTYSPSSLSILGYQLFFHFGLLQCRAAVFQSNADRSGDDHVSQPGSAVSAVQSGTHTHAHTHTHWKTLVWISWCGENNLSVGRRSDGQEGSIQGLTSKMMFIHRQQLKLTVLAPVPKRTSGPVLAWVMRGGDACSNCGTGVSHRLKALQILMYWVNKWCQSMLESCSKGRN